jgi:hypothetical protein
MIHADGIMVRAGGRSSRNSLRPRHCDSGNQELEDGGSPEDAIGIGKTLERGRPPEDVIRIGDPRVEADDRIAITIPVLKTGIPVPFSHDVPASAGMTGRARGWRVIAPTKSGMTTSLRMSRGRRKDGDRDE